ncbi:MAG: hypothetical protein R3211_04660 [Balneolaceae bacterium]|nr:hypothetical protein [Balneolaceae bacterium]
MRKILYSIVLTTLLIGTSVYTGQAQNDTRDDVRLFQSFFRDAPITSLAYGNGTVDYNDFDFFDRTSFGFQGGYAVLPELEIGAGIFYHSLNFEQFDSQSGIADIPVFGRYNFISEETTFSGGGFVTLPVGSEDIGMGNLNFGFFGAVRHPASEYVILTGNVGVDFIETPINDKEASLNLGGGVIYAANEKLNILGEISIQTETDFSALSGGADYLLGDIIRLRGNLLFGLDDNAPDFGVSGGVVFVLQ